MLQKNTQRVVNMRQSTLFDHPGRLGSFNDAYLSLLPKYKKIVDKIIRSKQFKADTEQFKDPGEVLMSQFFFWGTAVCNAETYLGKSLQSGAQNIRILTENEVSAAANIARRPYRTFKREYWEQQVRKRIPEYQHTPDPAEITELLTPDEILEMVKAGEYNFSYYLEQLQEWHDNNGYAYGTTLYPDSKSLADHIHTDIYDTTAVVGYIFNNELYYIRNYTSTAVEKLTKGIPTELRDVLENLKNKYHEWVDYKGLREKKD